MRLKRNKTNFLPSSCCCLTSILDYLEEAVHSSFAPLPNERAGRSLPYRTNGQEGLVLLYRTNGQEEVSLTERTGKKAWCSFTERTGKKAWWCSFTERTGRKKSPLPNERARRLGTPYRKTGGSAPNTKSD
ncbi:hypothetical protein ACQ4LE_001932 [Meloidogyne hapla]